MYCKSCGAQVNDDAKFCPSCGAQLEQPTYQQPEEPENDYFYDEEPKQEAPRQFGYEDHLDPSKNMTTSKSAFRGVQKEVGTSGKIEFGRTRDPHQRRFLPRVIIVIVIAIVAYFVSTMVGGCENVCDIETSDLVDYDTWEPVGLEDTFSVSDTEIFVTFKTNEYPTDSQIEVRWYHTDTNTYLGNDYAYTVTDELNIVYFSLTKPVGGWQLGDYEIEIWVNSQYIDSAYFSVE